MHDDGGGGLAGLNARKAQDDATSYPRVWVASVQSRRKRVYYMSNYKLHHVSDATAFQQLDLGLNVTVWFEPLIRSPYPPSSPLFNLSQNSVP